MRILLILFLLQKLIIYNLNAKLIYNCKSVHFSGKKYKDINVVFMTGYEILENIPENDKSIVKSKKYAVVLISDEKMMIEDSLNNAGESNKLLDDFLGKYYFSSKINL